MTFSATGHQISELFRKQGNKVLFFFNQGLFIIGLKCCGDVPVVLDAHALAFQWGEAAITLDKKKKNLWLDYRHLF